jgi:hypothetical protein
MFKRFGITLAFLFLSLVLVSQASAKGGSGGGGGGTPTPTPAPISPLVIDPDPLPNGNVGTSYVAFLTANGGRGTPYRWSVVAGRLPDGLTLANAYGVQSTVISGTPRTVQTSTFTVRVQDTTGHSATATFTITVSPPRPLTINQTSTLANGTVGQSYIANLFVDGGTRPYTWSVIAGQLPPGLSLSQNGSITGTPTTAGTYLFTVQVRDSASQQASQPFSITINP